ncbi:MAG TPA: AMP-dependent synthetase [Nitrosopumilus sp.]|nr:AMP-dependent synthetase [Nitrosopumilus sp.]
MSDFVFTPSEEQIKNSNIQSFMNKHEISSLTELSYKAKTNLDWYWKAVGEDIGIIWDKNYEKTSDFSKGYPWAKWFVGGKTNIIKSSVEKFSKKIPEKIAYYFVSEDSTKSKISYKDLETNINKLANGMKSLGVKKGDVVAIYMPMIKESIITILACAKIGAIQTVIFSGYSSESLKIRLQDCNAKILFVSDGFQRKGKKISQKPAVDEAIKDANIEKTIVVNYKGVDSYEKSDSLVFYYELISNQSDSCVTEIMDSEDPLFILYTSGTTGKPKGVIHSHGGFSVFAGHQAAYLIDMHQNDILFWPADIGWITGLVWNVYGLLEMGSSAVIYDGAIDWPDYNIIWNLLDEYEATIFGISPTAVRLFKKNNVEPLKSHNLEKIRNIPTTGEPIDEESWWWLFEKVGKKRIPIMNLSGGTEIGGALLSVFPGMRLKPTTVGIPCPGIDLDVFDDDGNSVKNKNGYLVVKAPWPGMTNSLLNDDKRYIETYWSRFENVWFHGDYVLVDEDGLWYMHGRVDDVINISGHRLSTAEIEQCVISNPKISDAASISIPDEITGEAIIIFVVPELQFKNENLENEISKFISEKIGKVARPKKILILSDLPKTRTGKIMRRLLKSKLLGNALGDLSSLENPQILDEIPKLS